jgi:hypothetical protein
MILNCSEIPRFINFGEAQPGWNDFRLDQSKLKAMDQPARFDYINESLSG